MGSLNRKAYWTQDDGEGKANSKNLDQRGSKGGQPHESDVPEGVLVGGSRLMVVGVRVSLGRDVANWGGLQRWFSVLHGVLKITK